LSTRQEPILWIQLIGIGVIPLEVLLIKLILAGATSGPIPSLERFLVVLIGIVLPTFLLFKRPADWGSLLLIKIPLKGRSTIQHQISSFQKKTIPQLTFIAGSLFLILIFWKIDQSALLFLEISPFKESSRLITLLFSFPILLLIVWQWHQICQSIWILTRSNEDLEKAKYLDNHQLAKGRINFGLDLFSLPKLKFSPSTTSTAINVDQATKK